MIGLWSEKLIKALNFINDFLKWSFQNYVIKFKMDVVALGCILRMWSCQFLRKYLT